MLANNVDTAGLTWEDAAELALWFARMGRTPKPGDWIEAEGSDDEDSNFGIPSWMY